MKKIMPIALCAVLCGCGETRVVDLDDTRDVAQMQNVMELEYRDWTNAAEKMTKSMIASGAFKRTAKPVVAIANIENDTMQRFDTDILTKKIRTTLVNSGTAQVTTAFQNKPATATAYVPATVKATTANIGATGASATSVSAKGVVPVDVTVATSEDDTTHIVRANRGNDEYNSATIAKKGTLVAPNLSLSGKMLQRNLKLKSGWFSNVDTRVEYYLQLTLTDTETGLSVWEDEQPIVKEGDHAPTW